MCCRTYQVVLYASKNTVGSGPINSRAKAVLVRKTPQGEFEGRGETFAKTKRPRV